MYRTISDCFLSVLLTLVLYCFYSRRRTMFHCCKGFFFPWGSRERNERSPRLDWHSSISELVTVVFIYAGSVYCILNIQQDISLCADFRPFMSLWAFPSRWMCGVHGHLGGSVTVCQPVTHNKVLICPGVRDLAVSAFPRSYVIFIKRQDQCMHAGENGHKTFVFSWQKTSSLSQSC